MGAAWSKFHKTLKIGIISLLLGSGPLLVIIGLDEIGIVNAGNAVGVGILALLSFYPSLILIIIGMILTFKKSRN